MNITDRQLATTLAALRYWQQDLDQNPDGPIDDEHFQEHSPLTSAEIDSLVDELNCAPLPGGGIIKITE